MRSATFYPEIRYTSYQEAATDLACFLIDIRVRTGIVRSLFLDVLRTRPANRVCSCRVEDLLCVLLPMRATVWDGWTRRARRSHTGRLERGDPHAIYRPGGFLCTPGPLPSPHIMSSGSTSTTSLTDAGTPKRGSRASHAASRRTSLTICLVLTKRWRRNTPRR